MKTISNSIKLPKHLGMLNLISIKKYLQHNKQYNPLIFFSIQTALSN